MSKLQDWTNAQDEKLSSQLTKIEGVYQYLTIWEEERVSGAMRRSNLVGLGFLVIMVAYINVVYPALSKTISALSPITEGIEEFTEKAVPKLTSPPKVGDKIGRYTVTSPYLPCTTADNCRKHPVTGVVRAHNGVDIDTPTGTPIYAPSNKKVFVHCWVDKNGGGKVASVAEGNVAFDYLHLSRCASGWRQGKIGETGATGIGTGPHLHFQQRSFSGDPKSLSDILNSPKMAPETFWLLWAVEGKKPNPTFNR